MNPSIPKKNQFKNLSIIVIQTESYPPIMALVLHAKDHKFTKTKSPTWPFCKLIAEHLNTQHPYRMGLYKSHILPYNNSMLTFTQKKKKILTSKNNKQFKFH